MLHFRFRPPLFFSLPDPVNCELTNEIIYAKRNPLHFNLLRGPLIYNNNLGINPFSAITFLGIFRFNFPKRPHEVLIQSIIPRRINFGLVIYNQ